jgi:hypothetical protein
MAMAIAFLALPLITFVSLALLPAGRSALIGIGVAALVVGLAVPRIAPDDGTGFGHLILWIFGGSVALAALAQAVRQVTTGQVSYPLVAGLCLLGATVPFLLMLGVM